MRSSRRVADPAGEDPDPAGEVTDPAVEDPDTAGEDPDPPGEVTDPAGQDTDPADIAFEKKSGFESDGKPGPTGGDSDPTY